jgi:hypothetical protein
VSIRDGNGATWVRWAAGIAATLIFALLSGIQTWIIHRIDTNEEKTSVIVESVYDLRMEMSLLAQEMRLERERRARENQGDN